MPETGQKKYKPFLYWSGQTVPPLLLLLVFNTHGPAMLLLLAIPVVACFCSLISCVIRLLCRQFRRLLRPALTLLTGSLLLLIAEHSMDVAQQEALALANDIRENCRQNSRCPETLSGWETANYGSKRLVGGLVKYIVFYTGQEKTFDLYLYLSLDWGKRFSGGVDQPVTRTQVHT